MLSREQVGWQESVFNSAVTLAGDPVLAITNTDTRYGLLIHRVRGSSSANLALKAGLTAAAATALAMPTILAADNFDIPGLYVVVPPGQNVYVDVSADDTPNISIQWSQQRIVREQGTGVLSIGT